MVRMFTTGITLIVLVGFGLSCSSSSDSENTPQSIEHDSQNIDIPSTSEPGGSEDTTLLTESEAIGTDGLATYDESIPDGGYSAFYIYHENLKSLSLASDIIFTGRITNYIESILTVPDPDTASIGLQIDVYDGIVFTVDEVIAGEIPANTQEITMLTFAMITDGQGAPMVRISDSPVEVVRSGIEQRNLPDGPVYLVFALREDDPSSPFYRHDFYYFNTPGSVVKVMDNGLLGVGVDKPLSSARVTDGEISEDINSLVMADVRGAVNVTQEINDSPGPQPQNEVPGGLLTDSTPGQTDPVPGETSTE